MVLKKILCLGFFSILLTLQSGCTGLGRNIRYEGTVKPLSEVSVVSLGVRLGSGFLFQHKQGGMVQEIDGENPVYALDTNNSDPAQILPGTHVFKVWLRTGVVIDFVNQRYSRKQAHAAITAKTEPGHSYVVFADRNGDEIRFELVDVGKDIPISCLSLSPDATAKGRCGILNSAAAP